MRAKTAHGWGEYSPIIYKTTGPSLGSSKNTQQQVQRKNGNKDDTGTKQFILTGIILKKKCFMLNSNYQLIANGFYFNYVLAYIGDEDNMEVRIIAGATVAVVVVLVVVIIMTVLFLRRYVVSIVIAALSLMQIYNYLYNF